ncbi:MAG: DNA starvation/stationary phase protection protein [Calditrichaceae bacterium]|nr:DNA starvation/stationary phase protection protein [Calditrichaceae bacterium]MBN2708212.1 DNA starvation/stationary phase protection protein [Calditrichaceae bacterium]RQV92236.1 MAG: DNA starvation/stationary phase protection protein [Calditrichota bacterium]
MASKKLVDKLNQNIADLHVLYVKLHNYHWNIKGSQFFQLHNTTEEYYEYIAELYDTVAERVLQLGSKPLATVKDYVQKAKITEETKTNFSSDDVITGIIKDFGYLLNHSKEILKLAEEQEDTGTADMVTGTISWLEKALWMLNSSKK